MGTGKRVDLAFEKDSFITVEVIGDASEDYDLVAPGFYPLAFSNPIFIDVDGDGVEWSLAQ